MTLAKSLALFCVLVGLMPGALAWNKPSSTPVLRVEGSMTAPKINRNGTLLAFVNTEGQSLRVLDLKTHEVVEVTPHKVGYAYLWSPDNARLVYRELSKTAAGQVESSLKIYDALLNKSVEIRRIPGPSGLLTFDPRDHTLFLMQRSGVMSHTLAFPGERRATWQQKKKTGSPSWVATQGAILALYDLGLSLKRLQDDGTGVESFVINPDGQAIAWATQAGRIYVAELEGEARFLFHGRDPAWHPYQKLLLSARSQRVGPKTYDYDLYLCDLKGQGRYLTRTADRAERWPLFQDAATFLFTVQGSTDLLRLNWDGMGKIVKRTP